MKKFFLSGLLVLLSCVSLFGVTSAVFEESASVAGVSFTIGEESSEPGGGGTTGNTALKILKNTAVSAEESNLADTINGPSFTNVNSTWVQTLPVKIYNKGGTVLDIVGTANYVNDPDTLRDDLYIEILAWNDANNNGTVEEGETGESYGHDTILRFKNDTFDLGELNGSSTRGYILKFDGSGLSEANIGKTAVYDFVFTGVEKVTQ